MAQDVTERSGEILSLKVSPAVASLYLKAVTVKEKLDCIIVIINITVSILYISIYFFIYVSVLYNIRHFIYILILLL